jgi:hypothetical protein
MVSCCPRDGGGHFAEAVPNVRIADKNSTFHEAVSFLFSKKSMFPLGRREKKAERMVLPENGSLRRHRKQNDIIS